MCIEQKLFERTNNDYKGRRDQFQKGGASKPGKRINWRTKNAQLQVNGDTVQQWQEEVRDSGAILEGFLKYAVLLMSCVIEHINKLLAKKAMVTPVWEQLSSLEKEVVGFSAHVNQYKMQIFTDKDVFGVALTTLTV